VRLRLRPQQARRDRARAGIAATEGQLAYEWQHLLRKLAARNPPLAERWRDEPPAGHPLFVVGPGPIAPWERP